MPCVPFRFCRPSGTHSFSSLPRTCVLGCNIPPLLRSFVVGSTLDLQIKSRGSYQGRLFSGAVRPNDELEGAGWRAKAPAPHGHHPSVCTSTESTAGRSRTIGFQLSPASAEAYTWPPVVPK